MPRVILPKEIQEELCLAARNKIGSNWADLARFLDVPRSSLYNWCKCVRLLPEDVFAKLIKLTSYQTISASARYLPDNWGQVKGGQRSIELHGKFFGTIEGRRKGARKAGINQAKEFVLPPYSENLAEFIGIMLGDGGISQNQISVTLGYTTDKKYVPYIRELIRRLFGARASIYQAKKKDAIRIRASGINLVKNLLTLGLVQGNKIKQQFNIPTWIERNTYYIKACIRGMIDTDGCVHRKVRREANSVEYRSVGITFCSYSKPLRDSLIKLFNIIGFKVAISGKTIYLCGKEQVFRYVNEIGFSNPKHLMRYQLFLGDYGWKKFTSENCLKPQATV